MLVFRILATIFLGVSFLSMALKNIALYNHSEVKRVFGWLFWTGYGILWRAFCIVAIWLI